MKEYIHTIAKLKRCSNLCDWNYKSKNKQANKQKN